MEPYLGTIQSFSFSFPPKGWALCDGAILQINQNESLYSLLGTIYGGDGRTTFALPDFRGRLSFGFGQSAGLSNHDIGSKGGQESVALTTAELPSHNHTANIAPDPPNGAKPQSSLLGIPTPSIYNNSASADATLKSSTIAKNGPGGSHANMQPYLVINWCIAITGTFPPRN